MSNAICPYCDSSFPIISSTCSQHTVSFQKNYIETESDLEIYILKCPTCNEYFMSCQGVGKKVKTDIVRIKPNSMAKQYPEYIPKQIRQDYEEAHAIVNLSPKASATLSRRCLQSMIRDFWKINEKNLFSEIGVLQGKVPPAQWKVLDSLRQLGNIGAHPEKDINLIIDIEPVEATKMLKVIEILMQDWYIQRHEQEQLYDDIFDISNTKQTQKKGK